MLIVSTSTRLLTAQSFSSDSLIISLLVDLVVMDTCAWTSIVSSDELKRSSHTVSVVEAKAYVFGGELLPRQPKDNLTYLIDLISKQCKALS